MKEIGKVVSTEGRQAVVQIQRSPACDRCGACKFGYRSNEMLITIPNPLEAKPGDHVELSLDSNQFIKASAFMYLFPLLALVLGVVIGYLTGDILGIERQLWGAVTGILFTGLSFVLIRVIEPLLKKSNQFTPKMVSIINTNKEEINNGK